MITLTELKSNFEGVLKNEHGILLYQKRGENSPSRSNYEYLCAVNKYKQGYIINNEISTYANSIDKLKFNIASYISTLPYHHAYYDKMLKNHMFIELIVRDYMSTLGFKAVTGFNSYDLFFDKKMRRYGIDTTFSIILNDIENESEKDDIEINVFESGSKWLSIVSKRDVESIKKTINTLISMYSLQSICDDISILGKIGGEDLNSIQVMKVDKNSTEPFNKQLKEKLLQLAELL
jgi:hypothetical protein